MDRNNVASAAKLLLEARRTGVGLKELPAACKPITAADANEIVDEVTKHIDDRTAVDSAIVGVLDPVRSREADTDEKNSAH